MSKEETKLEIFKSETRTITSLEVAEMLETTHSKLIRKLQGDKLHVGIIPILRQAQLGSADYFIESTYLDAQEKSRKCYLITKLGCDFLANKFTGEKGILFTAKYVKRFSEMTEIISSAKQMKANLLLAIYDGGQSAVIASKELTRIEVQEATAPLIPKAEFHDAVAVAENCVDFGEFAGTFQNNLGISFGRNKIMDWCRDMDYLCSSYNLKNKPSQQMIDSGYMKYKENINERNGKKYVTYKPLLTGKGQIWLTKKLSEYLNRVA